MQIKETIASQPKQSPPPTEADANSSLRRCLSAAEQAAKGEGGYLSVAHLLSALAHDSNVKKLFGTLNIKVSSVGDAIKETTKGRAATR